MPELSNADRELIARAEHRAVTDEQREHLKRVTADGALLSSPVNCPDYARTPQVIAALATHFLVVDEVFPDPRETLPPTDNAARKLVVSSVKVADRNGNPRKLPAIHGQPERDFPIERLIEELRGPYFLADHQSNESLNRRSGLAW